MSTLAITPLDYPAALEIATWRYPQPYASYNLGDDPTMRAAFLSRCERDYYQLRTPSGELQAFCCFGDEARVPGGDYRAPALDLGLGVRPDLTGRGLGRRYLDAVMAFGVERFAPQALRLTVAAFNARAIRLYAGAGFVERERFVSLFGGQEFMVMERSP